MFIYKTQIRLHHTDAAGILFFAHQFELIHDAYEDLIEELGFGFAKMLTKRDYFLPIVHAESDYTATVFAGDMITITITLGHIGDSSFSFEYILTNQNKANVGRAKTVHVTIDKIKRTKIPLPQEIRRGLAKFQTKNKSK